MDEMPTSSQNGHHPEKKKSANSGESGSCTLLMEV